MKGLTNIYDTADTYIVDSAGKISMQAHESTNSIMGVRAAQHYRILFLTNQF